MYLPPALKRRCGERFLREAEELGMPYLNCWEQHGREKGLKEGEAKGLARLDSLLRLAVVAKSLADFEKVLLPAT